MKKFPISVLCGAAAIALTIALYFIILDNVILQAIHFITLTAIVISEIITTVYAFIAKGSPRKVAAAVVSASLIPYSIILSAVYIITFPYGYAAYIGWYFIGLIVTNAIALVLICFDSRKAENNADLQMAKDSMLAMRKTVKCVMTDPAAQPYAARLRALEENLHFSNDCVIAAGDENIRSMLYELQDNLSDSAFDVDALLTRIEKAVRERKIFASNHIQ